MPLDLAVLGQDPRFGGGGIAQTKRSSRRAEALGRTPALLYDPHPGLGEAELHLAPRRGAAAAARGTRGSSAAARDARSLWVVATLAQHGGAAPRAGRPYALLARDDDRLGVAGPGAGPAGRAQRVAARREHPRRCGGSSGGVLERRHAALRDERGEPGVGRARPPASTAARSRLLPIPIDVERFAPEPDEAWLARLDAPIVGFVGRADDPRKNVGLLLDAFALVRRRAAARRGSG